MKGVVFNLLEEAVTEAFGADTWDDLLDDAGVSGAYTSLGNYSDAEIEALVEAAARRMEMEPEAVLRWFGERAMPLLMRRYPALFEAHASSRSFILSINTIIHPEVRKLYAGAACPFFHFREDADGALSMRYHSTRRMFDLAHGFVLGAAALWRETVTVARHAAASTTSPAPHSHDADVLVIRWA